MARLTLVTNNESNLGELQDTREFPGVEYLLSLRGSDSEDDEVDEDDEDSASDSSLDDRPYVITLNPHCRTRYSNHRLRHPCVPVHGESFCNCPTKRLVCKCGEDDTAFDWKWDSVSKSAGTALLCEDREVKFHSKYSCGTAAVRGDQPMTSCQHYWEVKMTTPVYGTDMMVGVGTIATNLDKFRYTFGSLLGNDSDSWGFSHSGNLYHKGVISRYSSRFGQGTIIGVHLDMWNGTLQFFKNRQPLGIAYKGLQGKTLFPMVSSTAARSGMKIVRCRSFDSSLQFLCCVRLREAIPGNLSVLEAVNVPPGLKAFLQNNLDWLLGARTTKDTAGDREQRAKLKRKFSHTEDSEESEEAEPVPKRQKNA